MGQDLDPLVQSLPVQRLDRLPGLLVVRLPSPTGQRLVDGLLGQHVFERVLPLGRQAGRVDEIEVGELQERKIAFRSLTEAIDTATPAGRLQLHLFAALAEFERELIRERAGAGREAARVRGRLGGRPKAVTPEKLAAAQAMRAQGELTMAQIARTLGVGRSTLYQNLDLGAERVEHLGDAA